MPTTLRLFSLRSIMCAMGAIFAFALASTACTAQVQPGTSDGRGSENNAQSKVANIQSVHKKPGTNQKAIKDVAEYRAYISALNAQDPVQKAALMEAFVNQYPQSVLKIDALVQAMTAYKQAVNVAKVEETDRLVFFHLLNLSIRNPAEMQKSRESRYCV